MAEIMHSCCSQPRPARSLASSSQDMFAMSHGLCVCYMLLYLTVFLGWVFLGDGKGNMIKAGCENDHEFSPFDIVSESPTCGGDRFQLRRKDVCLLAGINIRLNYILPMEAIIGAEGAENVGRAFI